MPDLDKVIREIKLCTSGGPCEGCSHYDHREDDLVGCMDELLSDALELLKEQEAENSKISNAYLELVGKASKQPQIVRCKDCKYRSEEMYDYYHNPNDKRYVCQINDLAKKPDWYCADGERGSDDG